MLDESSQGKLQEYVEKPEEELDEDYYWLLQILYDHKGSYVYDSTNNIIMPKSDYYTYVTAL